jgi:hypothetical protein
VAVAGRRRHVLARPCFDRGAPFSVCRKQENEKAKVVQEAREQSKGKADQGQEDEGDSKQAKKDLASKTPATTQKRRVFGKGKRGSADFAVNTRGEGGRKRMKPVEYWKATAQREQQEGSRPY